MQESFVDLTIKDSSYQVRQLEAMTGSYILSAVLSKTLPGWLQLAGIAPASNSPDIGEEEFRRIQTHLLSVVYRVDKGAAFPILISGRWAYEDLKYDLNAVMKLTVASLKFNILPFFKDGGLSGMLEALGLELFSVDPNSSDIPTSTSSPSDQ